MAGQNTKQKLTRTDQRFLTVKQIASLTGQSQKTVRDAVDDGLLTPFDTMTKGKMHYMVFLKDEAHGYIQYLIGLGKIKKARSSSKERKRLILKSVARYGVEHTAQVFNLKVSSLMRNFRNWGEPNPRKPEAPKSLGFGDRQSFSGPEEEPIHKTSVFGYYDDDQRK